MNNLTKFLFPVFLLILVSCKDETPAETKRTYRMGFQNSAPRFDSFDMAIQSLNLWTTRADAAIISVEVPWKDFLNGTKIVPYVVTNYKDLVTYYRGKGFKLWVYIDPANGLDRSADAVELVAVGKSIADADMQDLYRRFVFVMDSVLQPEHLGLALETNLIRAESPTSIYNGVKQAVNGAAHDVRQANANVKLSVSVQTEQAWGKFAGNTYEGVAQDYTDFPFMQELGISSYAYFAFDTPDDIPLNYYSRLQEGKNFPVFVSEGGWTSVSVTTDTRTFVSTPELQQKYIARHAQLLDEARAIGYFQLTFTDFDPDYLPGDVPANLAYFIYLGLVDKNFQAKAALETWDKVFKRPFTE